MGQEAGGGEGGGGNHEFPFRDYIYVTWSSWETKMGVVIDIEPALEARDWKVGVNPNQ